MSTLEICPPHLSDVSTLPWKIQKSHSSTLLYIYFRLFTLPQKKANSNCCTAALAVYLLHCCLVLPNICTALVLRLGPCTTGGADMLRPVAAACCDMGWISAQRGTLWLTSVKKDWKRVLMQKVVTLNTCCDVACLTFQLPHIKATNENPQLALFRAVTFERTQQTFSRSSHVCVVSFLCEVGKCITVCFLLR